VGIDVEPLNRNHEGLEEIAFTAEEGTHLSAVPLSRKKEWLLRLWCSKEASCGQSPWERDGWKSPESVCTRCGCENGQCNC
jgi:hypothetical protein